MVVDRQQDGLEQDGLGEGALDDQEWGVGEVGLALGVAHDVTRELVVGEPGQEVRREDRSDPIEGVAGEPDVFALAQADRAGVIQLFAQRAAHFQLHLFTFQQIGRAHV